MLRQLFQDKAFFRRMLTLALPMVIQNLITFSLGAVDMIMIGQLGDQAVAAVGLGDQIFFLLILMLFGIASGAGIFAAQYWGKHDLIKIHKVLGLCLGMSLIGGLVFTVIALVAPEGVLSIYSKDPVVVALGSNYLRIVGLSYMATAVAVSYTFILRSIENVKLPMIIGAIVLVLNTGLNYVLIFGHFGFPPLGVTGAAIATSGARILEPILLISVIYLRNLPLAAPPRRLISVERPFVPKFLKTSFPVVLTEVVWSLGITTYSVIYARISTEAIAAINIVVTIERLAFVIFIALANACAIMIGNRIGANKLNKANIYAKRYIIVALVMVIPVSLTVIFSADLILSFYNVSDTVSSFARNTMTVMGIVLPIKIMALMVFIGVLRSGGDTRFSLYADAGFIWLIGVPLAFTGAFLLGLPVYWVYLLVVTEEVGKVSVALWRFFTGKWIHALAEPEFVTVG